MQIVPILIGIAAILGSIPVFLIAYLYRDEQVVPVGKRAFWAMGLGLLSIGALYFSTAVLGPTLALVPYTTGMWLFIIGSTVALSYGVLEYRRNGWGDWWMRAAPRDEEECGGTKDDG